MPPASDDHRPPEVDAGFSGRLRRAQRHVSVRLLLTAGSLFASRRVFGLAAEGAFWATFTLPWVVLGIVSATSGVAAWLGQDVGTQVNAGIVEGASQVLTKDTIDTTLVPLLDSIAEGSTGLSVLGFVVALWSGSRVFATFVVGSEILAGRPASGFVYTRLVALGIYLLALVTLAVVVFTAVQFPDFWAELLGIAPGPGVLWGSITGLVFMTLSVTTMLFLADPERSRWPNYLPGGGLALVVWIAASWGLSVYFKLVVEQESFYGAVAAPIAIMLWLFVSVLAVFVGMTLTAAVRLTRRGLFIDPMDPHVGAQPFPAAAGTGPPAATPTVG